VTKDKKQKRKTIPVTRPGAATAAVMATYADGRPLDKEAKLILKPDRFTSVQNCRDFGKMVKQTAKKLGMGLIADPDADQRPAS